MENLQTYSRKHYDNQFKIEIVKLIEKENYSLGEASVRLGISKSTLSKWKHLFGPNFSPANNSEDSVNWGMSIFEQKQLQKIFKLLKNVGGLCSMSGKGNCYDNAVAESFFNSTKTELGLGSGNIFKTKQEAKDAIFEYIEGFYNRTRKYSKLNYCSPMQFEQYLLSKTGVA